MNAAVRPESAVYLFAGSQIVALAPAAWPRHCAEERLAPQTRYVSAGGRHCRFGVLTMCAHRGIIVTMGIDRCVAVLQVDGVATYRLL